MQANRGVGKSPGSAGTTYRKAEQLDRVVGKVLSSRALLTAYVIARIAASLGLPLSATQVYRVLDRLIARGQVVRIETLNAYTFAPDCGYGFVACRKCRTVKPIALPVVGQNIQDLCVAMGFAISKPVLEVSGLCVPCREVSNQSS